MDRSVKRVLLYLTLGVILYGTATLFAESQIGFIVVFGAGALIVVAAEVLFWIHIVRLSLRRQRQ
jgi:hypothetical protein